MQGIRRISWCPRLRWAKMPGESPDRGESTMRTATEFLRRDPAEVEPWAETCGQIRPLIEERDGAAAEVHHLEITNARLHYHEQTDEIYYIIQGEGKMRL